MGRRYFVAVAFLLVAFSARAERRGAVDWIFLVDTSKSMRGVGGTADIFDDVKESIDTFVRESSDGDSVSIFTFDRDVRLQSSTEISGTARDDLYSIVAGLPANGDRTHLGLAIEKGLDRAASLRALKPDPSRARAVVLFTDGKEDIRGIADAVPIRADVARVADTFVFFVSMGDHEPKLDKFEAETTRTTVLRVPSRDAIRSVAQKIRAKLPAPKPPPPPRIAVAKTPVPVAKPSPLVRAIKWLVAVALLAGIALFAYARYRKNNQLEGEIEILQPRVASDAAFVGLPALQTNEVTLSSIVPSDALSGSDARLFVRRRNGTKTIWISAHGGSLRVNDVETPMSELYDADTIHIGDAKLRFNRAGHQRPEEDL